MSLLKHNLLVSKLIMKCSFLYLVSFQDANFEMVNVVVICIEMHMVV